MQIQSTTEEKTMICPECKTPKPLSAYGGKKGGAAPKPGDMCKACRAKQQAQGREGKERKTPEHILEKQRDRMRRIRENDPLYGQPRVNRRTLAYCSKCRKIMPWSEAEGSVRDQKDLTCPDCHTTLKTVAKARPVGKEGSRHKGTALCVKCVKETYWNTAAKAKNIDGETIYVCDCGEPLHVVQAQSTHRNGDKEIETSK